MSDVHFNTIALIGIGLIGSSLARVIKREGLADKRSSFPPAAKPHWLGQGSLASAIAIHLIAQRR